MQNKGLPEVNSVFNGIPVHALQQVDQHPTESNFHLKLSNFHPSQLAGLEWFIVRCTIVRTMRTDQKLTQLQGTSTAAKSVTSSFLCHFTSLTVIYVTRRHYATLCLSTTESATQTVPTPCTDSTVQS